MKSYYLRTFTYFKPHWKSALITLFIIIIYAAANVYFIPLIRDISKEISKKRTQFIYWQIINAFGLWTIRTFAQFGQNYMTNKIGVRIMLDIQESIYRKLTLCSQHFFSRWKTGEILVRIFNDSAKVKESIVISLSQIAPQFVTMIAVICYLFSMNWALTLFTFITIPLFVATISYFANLIKKLAEQVQKKSSSITHIIQETLANMKLVQAYTMEKECSNRLERENNKNFTITMKSVRLWETKKSMELLLQGVIIITLLLFGGHLVAKGQLTGPELISFFTGCALLIDPIIAFSQGYTKVQESLVSARRIYDILDYVPHVESPKNGIKKELKGTVSLRNVNFYYNEKDEKIIDNINLNVKAGESIAIVGLSGAGKTTLTNLITRFYDTSTGSILIDNENIKDYDLYALRSQIAIVLQENLLFSGTLMENIRFGNPGASEDMVIQAAEAAHCLEFIEKMPDKFFTRIGDKGMRLSGGQKQRISIARAILRNPKILILDEATSSLDSQSEQHVQEAFIELMKNRTTFVIAHRLSTIKHTDKIIVLDKGKIIETGSHDELITKNGHYKHLYNLQFR